eukprot:scaffold47128_cov63-Phaeocystis_antarctica.AAC.1
MAALAMALAILTLATYTSATLTMRADGRALLPLRPGGQRRTHLGGVPARAHAPRGAARRAAARRGAQERQRHEHAEALHRGRPRRRRRARLQRVPAHSAPHALARPRGLALLPILAEHWRRAHDSATHGFPGWHLQHTFTNVSLISTLELSRTPRPTPGPSVPGRMLATILVLLAARTRQCGG